MGKKSAYGQKRHQEAPKLSPVVTMLLEECRLPISITVLNRCSFCWLWTVTALNTGWSLGDRAFGPAT